MVVDTENKQSFRGGFVLKIYPPFWDRNISEDRPLGHFDPGHLGTDLYSGPDAWLGFMITRYVYGNVHLAFSGIQLQIEQN